MLNHTYKKVIFPDTLPWKHVRAVLLALSYIVIIHTCMHTVFTRLNAAATITLVSKVGATTIRN